MEQPSLRLMHQILIKAVADPITMGVSYVNADRNVEILSDPRGDRVSCTVSRPFRGTHCQAAGTADTM